MKKSAHIEIVYAQNFDCVCVCVHELMFLVSLIVPTIALAVRQRKDDQHSLVSLPFFFLLLFIHSSFFAPQREINGFLFFLFPLFFLYGFYLFCIFFSSFALYTVLVLLTLLFLCRFFSFIHSFIHFDFIARVI